jgi:thiamine kinase-like enzyme
MDDVRIEPLASLTNRTFRVTLDGAGYVLRIPGAGTDAYIDRAAEAHNARLAAAFGIAPDVLYADPQSGVMVTRLVPDGISLSAAHLQRPDTLEWAVGLLKRLHESRLPFRGRMELFPKLDQYIALASRKGWPEGLNLAPVRRAAEAARSALERPDARWAPCHIDPVPDNFIAVPSMAGAVHYLLDWEYAAMGEPMWDLAAVSIEAALDEPADGIVLEVYFGATASEWRGRFVLYKSLLCLLAAAWAVVQLVDGNPRLDFAALGRDRLSRHLDLAESGAYRAYIARTAL